MESLLRDLKFSARALLKHPGFTAVAVLTLALGIGANTTIFSTVDALILHPFSFPNQDRLVVVWEQNRAVGFMRGSVSPGNFTEWRDQNQVFEQLVAIQQKSFDVSEGSYPERFPGYGVTQGFFDALGAKAARGRILLPEDSEPGREQVVVLKHSFWQQHLGADPGIVGQTINLNRKQFTVVGVMPADFNYPYNGGEMWTPLVFDREEQKDRGNHYLRVMGLLKPGVSVAQAQAGLGPIAQRAQQQFPETNSGRDARVETLTDDAVRGARTGVPILMGAVVFVLLIACANVANLLLVRAASRQRETVVRLALGASRTRLIRETLTESALLALLGGALGLLISVWAIAALARGIPEGFSKFIPGWSHLGVNLTVLAFTFVVSMLTGTLAGLAPVWHATRTNLNEALKAGGRSEFGNRTRSWLRSTLVVSEVALSLVLLIGAGLMVRSFVEMQRADLGIRAENVLAMEISLPRDKYEDKNKRRDFYQQLLQRVGVLPGVVKAGAVNIVPISGSGDNGTFQIVGQPPVTKGQEPYADIRVATPGYFEAIGINPNNLLTMQINLPGRKYDTDPKVINFYKRAIEQLHAVPGVEVAGAINNLPFNGPHSGTNVEIEGQPKLPPGQELGTGVCVTDANFFQAMRIPLKRGRLFTEQEATEMRHVVVVNETFVRQNLPGQEPIGKRVTINMKDENVPTEIIGVVGDNKHMGLDTEIEPMAYWPHPELTYSSMTLAIRTQGEPTSVASAARNVIRNLDPEQPVGEVSTMNRLMAKSIARSRFNATLLAVFSLVALVMATVGIYGVISYSVQLRTHEIGVRMALGAQQGDVLRLVVKQGISLGSIGVAVGLVASFGLTRLIASLLFEVTATDKTTFGLVATGLFVVTLVACYLPARRATKVDPLVALRYE